MKIAITGSTGLIGSRIVELLSPDLTFIPVTQQEVDITNRESLENKLNNLDFDLFLHLAAYTNVDGAEEQRDLAYAINVTGTKNVFETVQAKGKKFIHVSTDFVFDGEQPPYYEDSVPHAISYYGQTKLDAENIVKGNAMIVRLSYPYRAAFEPKKDFMRVIKSLLEQGKELKMVSDSLMTPTFVDDIAYSLKYLINNYTPEIFHVVGADSMSPYEAGKLIAQTFGLDENLVQPTTYEEYFAGKAQRPRLAEIKTSQ
ncbi:sugar nucleotide-binding protein, partial [Candidatus Roizmanbacteria bacterium]|nr:sugar nucleotide-binding protein [Candidatus Roizmanbacteria bacterium]